MRSLSALLPSKITLRRLWSALTSNPSQPASLSIFTVSLNLFSTSLHPAVLLSLPFYFSRTEVLLGILGLCAVAILGGVGGGLWVVLGRYVNATNVENIVGAGCARNSRWRAEIGRTVTGLLVGTYATGSAFIAYFALADLLLQIFFHYSPRGIPLHDRAFVTLVIGGIFTTPLLVFPLAKRTLIRLNSGLTIVLYPLILTILFAKIYTWEQETLPSLDVTLEHPKKLELPNANPFSSPSIWGPYSLLPLLTLSSSPLQIMQHQRSLRRKGLSGSNVKAFMGAQTGQVLAVIGVCTAMGVGVGLKGMHERLGLQLHPNLFTSLPKGDDTVNFARLLFVLLLSSHLTLCVVTARSSWSRILRRFKLNPLRRRRRVQMSSAGIIAADDSPHVAVNSSSAGPHHHQPEATGECSHDEGNPPRRWGKLARNALAGLILWALVAGLAYASGNGRIRRGDGEKDGEEARFTRASEVLGLMGAAVGFVLPSLVWVILFWIRRPRSILPVGESQNARDLERRPLLPRSALSINDHRPSPSPPPPAATAAGRHEGEEGTGADSPHWHPNMQALPTRTPRGGGDSDYDAEDEGQRRKIFRTWLRESNADHRDEQTAILLAKKERQMQKKTKGMRRWQDLLVIGGVLPLGMALLLLGAIELHTGAY
ncbi:hypothetical protein K437DRAFT_248060 [Tilletiaria anomala UBC 951]|uniref:Amino acid transporter transmembrane domain-containing protein n=1 Tax=Tilletiaria anomala (strain ATCC 24038 / CBS 436.72 / UBC 951) TaxID=1037660 RepID=A0A066VZW1_TILAU|nr:uncharacterized protein K437DRAFT_248060 [Tilletiaria anomala UBC 951]KDN44085.1 hypothetical protein K437DRAFT_248060 [Tilletiaria anomala UBC 951]